MLFRSTPLQGVTPLRISPAPLSSSGSRRIAAPVGSSEEESKEEEQQQLDYIDAPTSLTIQSTSAQETFVPPLGSPIPPEEPERPPPSNPEPDPELNPDPELHYPPPPPPPGPDPEPDLDVEMAAPAPNYSRFNVDAPEDFEHQSENARDWINTIEEWFETPGVPIDLSD